MKKKVMLIGIIIILILLATFGASVALFNGVRTGSSLSSIQVGDLTFKYSEVTGIGNGISLEDAESISDEVGKSLTTWFDFKIDANLVNSDMIYDISVEPTSQSTINLDGVKIYLTELVDGKEIDINSNYNGLGKVKVISNYDNGIIYQERILKNTKQYEKNFRVRIWISEDVDIYTDEYMGTIGAFKINVNAKSDISMVDASIPVPEITGGTGEAWVVDSQIISVLATNPVIGGIKEYEYYVTDDENDIPNDLTIETGNTNNEFHIETEGANYVYYRTVINNGSKSAWSSPELVKYEKIKTPTIAEFINKKMTTTEVSFSYIVDESLSGISSVECYYGDTTQTVTNVGSVDMANKTCSYPPTASYAQICYTKNIGTSNCSQIKQLAVYIIKNGISSVNFTKAANIIMTQNNGYLNIQNTTSGTSRSGIYSTSYYDFSNYGFGYIDVSYNVSSMSTCPLNPCIDGAWHWIISNGNLFVLNNTPSSFFNIAPSFRNDTGTVKVINRQIFGNQIDTNAFTSSRYEFFRNSSYAVFNINLYNLWFQLKD